MIGLTNATNLGRYTVEPLCPNGGVRTVHNLTWGVQEEDSQSLELRAQSPGTRIQGTEHRVLSLGSRALNPEPRILSPEI